MITVKDLMTPNPVVVTADASLRSVVEVMQRRGFRQLPVVEDGKLVGIITERDVRVAMGSLPQTQVNAELNLLDELTTGACMTANPVTVAPETPAYRAAEMLSLYKFGALLVVSQERVVGIITVTDILGLFDSKGVMLETAVAV